MNNYSQSANPNATNSELDSKRIITHKELTSLQKDELIAQYVELLVDNVTSLNDNEEPWLQPLFLSNLSQIGQEQVNGANILCVLIVNQSAKFITLVGQDYNALNVKNVLTNYSGA